MPVPLDLDSFEAVVNAYLGGGQSYGWPVLDALERHLAVNNPPAGTEEEKRARGLLARIRSKLTPSEEIAHTEAALREAVGKLDAGMAALRERASKPPPHEPGAVDLWNAVAAASFETAMYEKRLKNARER